MRDFASQVERGFVAPVQDVIHEEEESQIDLTALATSLFGDGDGSLTLDHPVEGTEWTESTATPPSPQASSRACPPSERSDGLATEDVDVDGDVEHTPATGIRLLQQRRRAARRMEHSQSESEDLVQLWMKQRW